jgi:hypothetical protein
MIRTGSQWRDDEEDLTAKVVRNIVDEGQAEKPGASYSRRTSSVCMHSASFKPHRGNSLMNQRVRTEQ